MEDYSLTQEEIAALQSGAISTEKKKERESAVLQQANPYALTPEEQKALAETKPEMPQGEAPGAIEALLRGGAQGATFEFADEAEAKMMSVLSGRPYEEVLPEVRAKYKTAKEEHPYLSFAGELGGSLAVPLGAVGAGVKGLGMAGKLGRMAATGAVYGGVAGLGASETDLVKNPEQALKEAGQGAIIGGVAAPALGTVGAAIGEFASPFGKKINNLFKEAKDNAGFLSDMFEGRKLVDQGYDILTKKGKEDVAQKVIKAEKGINESVDKLADELSSDLQDLYNRSTSKEDVKNFYGAVESGFNEILKGYKNPDTLTKITSVKDTLLSEILGAKPSELQAIATEISDRTGRDARGVYQTLVDQKLSEKLSLKQLRNVKETFGEYAEHGRKTGQEYVGSGKVSALVNRLLSPAKTAAGEARALSPLEQQLIPEGFVPLTSKMEQMASQEGLPLAEMNKKVSSVLRAQEKLPDISSFEAAGKTPLNALEKKKQLGEFTDLLKQAAPEKVDEILKDFPQLASSIRLGRLTEETGLGTPFSVRSKWIQLGALAKGVEKGTVAAFKEGTAKPVEVISNLTNKIPEDLQMVGKKLVSSGNKAASFLGEQIIKIAKEPEQRRKALIFALTQNPGYRKILSETGLDNE